MNIKSIILLLSVFIVAILFSGNVVIAGQQGLSPENLWFQADIFGGTSQETIEYLSNLSFQNFGGFGTNAHIYRASLQSGDEIAFAVSANDPNAFSLQVIPNLGAPVTLTVTKNDYSAGVVTMPSPNELHFTWEIEQSGLHVNLHRHVTLDPNSDIVREVFSVENLGPAFTLNSFSEFLHIDDKVAVQDYDCDGTSETLLAINTFSSSSYPVFGKLYEQSSNHRTEMFVAGNFATVKTTVNSVSGLMFKGNGEENEISAASYVSSTAKDGALAEQQVTSSIMNLLDLDQLPDRWLLRSYKTDDRGAAFINGLMVVGTVYSAYPDSGWVNVCKHWNNEDVNNISFASWDLGGCCNATYGFGIKRNDKEEWTEPTHSAPTGLGITYTETLKVSPSGEITEYDQALPSTTLDGNWELTVQASGGFAFVLLDNLPIVGSTNNIAQKINLTDLNLLGEQDNHIHLNTWNNGLGTHEWHFSIEKDNIVVWQSDMIIPDGIRGRSHHIHLVIDENGNVYPLLDLPIDYQDRSNGSITNFNTSFNERINSVFDHESPIYQDGNSYITPYTGRSYPNSGGSADCDPSQPNDFPLGCYDEHDAYDISRYCGAESPCSYPYAVFPAADGEIMEDGTGWKSILGCQITINHGNGWQTVYSHLDGPGEDPECRGLLRDSGTVTQYDAIARIGCSGSGCTGDGKHLHFVVKHNGIVVDPSGWQPDPQILADPWISATNGTASYPMWLYTINTGQRIVPNSGGQLILPMGKITVAIPPGFHTLPLTFNLSNIPVNSTTEETSTGYSFSLTAMDDAGNFIDEMAANISMQVRFDPIIIQGFKSSTLSLYSWNENSGTWQAVPTIIDFDKSIATAQINYLSDFALMGELLDYIYLPIVLRSN